MITCEMLTERGGRDINEDSAVILRGTDRLLLVLADGLGGHGAGEVASALVTDSARSLFEEGAAAEALLAGCLDEAQERLLSAQQANGRKTDLKTTAVALLLEEGLARWAHIGDSRLYVFEGTKILTRTLDHSVPQMLVYQGEIREKDIRFHEDRNRLLRVLGEPWETPRYMLSEPLPLAPPMTFLLCTDGFWEWVEEREMARSLRRCATPRQWLEAMERVALENGRDHRMDNYTAIAVFVR